LAGPGTPGVLHGSNRVATNKPRIEKEPTMRKIVFALALAIPMSWSFASFAQGGAAAPAKTEKKAPAKKTAKTEKKDEAKPAATEKKDEAQPAATPAAKDEKAAPAATK
jgi:hypothetical protein